MRRLAREARVSGGARGAGGGLRCIQRGCYMHTTQVLHAYNTGDAVRDGVRDASVGGAGGGVAVGERGGTRAMSLAAAGKSKEHEGKSEWVRKGCSGWSQGLGQQGRGMQCGQEAGMQRAGAATVCSRVGFGGRARAGARWIT
ncbi:hypothetical protein PMAC_002018 [Pneumocystis sp. 'macacae']|nr:hypothetical protein PMAC_002018 [Pneumocystis sp. 'macacae']